MVANRLGLASPPRLQATLHNTHSMRIHTAGCSKQPRRFPTPNSMAKPIRAIWAPTLRLVAPCPSPRPSQVSHPCHWTRLYPPAPHSLHVLTRHGAGALQQPAYAHALPSPAQQHFAQNRQIASPSAISGQPYATPQAPPSQGTLPSNGQQQQPMNQPRPEAPQVQTPVKPIPHSPVSPVAQARNQDRVTTLLEINSILIREVCELQSQGKAGQVGPPAEGQPEGDKPQASKEFVEYVTLRPSTSAC